MLREWCPPKFLLWYSMKNFPITLVQPYVANTHNILTIGARSAPAPRTPRKSIAEGQRHHAALPAGLPEPLPRESGRCPSSIEVQRGTKEWWSALVWQRSGTRANGMRHTAGTVAGFYRYAARVFLTKNALISMLWVVFVEGELRQGTCLLAHKGKNQECPLCHRLQVAHILSSSKICQLGIAHHASSLPATALCSPFQPGF
jgi:hypothetical protein